MAENVTVNEMKVIVFRLLEEEYGVDVNQVLSIERLENITRVPRTPPFVKGVINLRGVVTPVIDLRSRFDLEETEPTTHSRIIIVTVDQIEVGLIVDSANDVIDISRDALAPPPEVVGGIEATYLQGVAKLDDRLLILLNLEQVLHPEEIIQIRQIEELK